MTSCGVSIEMKPLRHYFHEVLLIQYVVLTFEFVDDVMWCAIEMTPLQQYF